MKGIETTVVNPSSSGGGGGGGTWGSITGTLSDQTDLGSALNAKAPSASPTFTGNITTPLTASRVAVTDGSSRFSVSAVTSTVLAFLDIGSSLTTLLGLKAPAASPTFTGTIGTPLTASRALVTDGSGNLAVSAVTSAVLAFLDIGSSLTTLLGAKAPLANPTFTGSIKFGNYHIEPSEADAGNSSTSLTVDLSTSAAIKVTMTGNCTLTLSNPVTGATYALRLVQDATGLRTMTWPAAVKWVGGIPPTLSSAAAAIDIIALYYDGTSYYGTASIGY